MVGGDVDARPEEGPAGREAEGGGLPGNQGGSRKGGLQGDRGALDCEALRFLDLPLAPGPLRRPFRAPLRLPGALPGLRRGEGEVQEHVGADPPQGGAVVREAVDGGRRRALQGGEGGEGIRSPARPQGESEAGPDGDPETPPQGEAGGRHLDHFLNGLFKMSSLLFKIFEQRRRGV